MNTAETKTDRQRAEICRWWREKTQQTYFKEDRLTFQSSLEAGPRLNGWTLISLEWNFIFQGYKELPKVPTSLSHRVKGRGRWAELFQKALVVCHLARKRASHHSAHVLYFQRLPGSSFLLEAMAWPQGSGGWALLWWGEFGAKKHITRNQLIEWVKGPFTFLAWVLWFIIFWNGSWGWSPVEGHHRALWYSVLFHLFICSLPPNEFKSQLSCFLALCLGTSY